MAPSMAVLTKVSADLCSHKRRKRREVCEEYDWKEVEGLWVEKRKMDYLGQGGRQERSETVGTSQGTQRVQFHCR